MHKHNNYRTGQQTKHISIQTQHVYLEINHSMWFTSEQRMFDRKKNDF